MPASLPPTRARATLLPRAARDRRRNFRGARGGRGQAQPRGASRRSRSARRQSGNYLSAMVAGADRDTAAAAVYFARSAARRSAQCRSRRARLRRGARRWRRRRRLSARRPAGRARSHQQPGAPGARRARDRRRPIRRRAHASSPPGEAGKAHDVTTTLLTAWGFAGAWRSAARARGARPHPRAGLGGVPRLPRRPDRRPARQCDSKPQRRLKAAYDADKNTLRLADAYARCLARHGDVDGRQEGLCRIRAG